MAKRPTRPANSYVDPSENVKLLVEAGLERQDALREMDSRYQREISDREIRHIKEITDLRASCDNELRLAEAKRIDAIRAVDVGAVQRAAEVAGAQAETLRTTVATTAQAQVQERAAALEPIQKDVSDLRRVQYEQQGQTAQRAESKGDQRSDSSRTWLILGFAGATLFSLLSFLLGAAALVFTVTR